MTAGRRTTPAARVPRLWVAGMALACGLALDYAFNLTGINAVVAGHDLMPQAVKSVCAVALLGLLAWSLVGDRLMPAGEAGSG
ncbi:MAG: hypothetical protein ABR497_07885 [Kiritimatiellia bacterium]|nr:hypothetical protein [Lentisphaerota bacterium]